MLSDGFYYNAKQEHVMTHYILIPPPMDGVHLPSLNMVVITDEMKKSIAADEHNSLILNRPDRSSTDQYTRLRYSQKSPRDFVSFTYKPDIQAVIPPHRDIQIESPKIFSKD